MCPLQVSTTQSVNLPYGTPCTKPQKAKVLSEHLRDNVWILQDLLEPCLDPLAPPHTAMDLPFIMADLYYSLRRIKTGRAPGPDNLPMQTLRLLPHPVKHKFLSHYI